MNIEIVKAHTEHYANLGRYFFAELRSGKHHMSLAFGSGRVQVCVHNASNRCWKGLGKSFGSVELALANYRTPAIQAMIREAARLNDEAARPMDARMAAVQNAGQAGRAWEC